MKAPRVVQVRCWHCGGTANHVDDDPTVRKDVRLARRWDFDGLVIVNAFAFRTSKPSVLEAAHKNGVDVVGPENDAHIIEAITHADLVVAAWGRMPSALLWREEQMERLLTSIADVYAIRVLEKPRAPGHPLYVPDASKPVLYLPRQP